MFRALVASLVGLMVPVLAHAFDVTACGQVVPPRETGVLQVDLTGCGSSAVGAFLSDRSELDLNGHAIASGAIGVHCTGKRCTVHGPGEIRNVTVHGLRASFKNARVRVEDVNVHDSAFAGIVADSGRPRITVERVQATGNAVGIETIFSGQIVGEDVDASNNRSSGIVAGRRFRFTRLTLLNTGAGDPHPEDDGLVCLYGGGSLTDSTVTGSAGADLATFKRPRLVRSTCGTSRFVGPGGATWGICTND
jgi:hypothetical protein